MRQKQFLLAFLAMLLCFAAPSFAQVAKVDGTPYTTLAEAIKNASAGQTIELIADVNESVTISKSLTIDGAKIDGAKFKYTGTMTVNNVTATIQNVAFYQGQVYKNKKSGNKAIITIKDCSFDGEGLNAYAVNIGGSSSIILENVTAQSYGYGLLQVPSSCAGLIIKNVNVSNCYYGFKVDYANAVSMESVTIAADVNTGIYDSNFGTKTYTIKNSNLNAPIGIWDRKTGYYTTFKFEDVNTVASLPTSAYAKVEAQATDGKGLYGDLASVVAAAKAGDTVKLLKNATGAGVVINKDITIDFNGKTYSFNKGVGSTGTESNGFQILKGNNVTLKKGTLNVDAEAAANFYILVQNYANLTVEDMNLDGTNLDKWSKVVTDQDSYVLSNNSGNVLVKGNTNITANNEGDKAFAFDACTKAGYNAPVVTIETTGIIDGKIENSAKIVIKSGTFTTPLDASWFEAGYSCKNNGDGTYGVAVSAIKIGEQGYETLAAALTAAKAGDTITFVADVTEDVTISKAVTIDGAGKTYTGKMTLKADATIKNVNFDGKGYNGYAVETRGANNLTIEDCTAKNYGYGFVQLASGTVLTTVKNVTVSDMNYGVKVDYSNAVVLENVDITATVAAVLNSNYGEKTITVKNSELNILGTWTRNNTTKTNYVFEGENTIDEFKIDAAIDNFKLVAGATLTAPAGITVTTVEDYEVEYKNGVYTSVEAGKVVLNGKKYKTFDEAYAAAREGDVIELLETIVLEPEEDKTYENVSVNAAFDDVAFRIQGAKKVTFKNAKVTSNDYCFIVGEKEGENKPTLEIISGEYKGETTIVSVTRGTASILGGTFAAEPWEGNYTYTLNCYDATYKTGDAKIEVKGGSFKNFDPANNAAEGIGTNFVADNYCSVKEGDDYKVVEAAAKVGNKGYATFSEAYAAAQAGQTITLCKDLASSEIIVLDKAITLDGNGKKLTSTAARAINVSGADGVTIKDLTINASGERAINVINNATNVTVEGVTATAANYTVNLAASAANAVVAIKASNLTGLNVVNVAAKKAQVTIEGGKITCNDQTSTENYAALALNKEAVNATIVATGVTFDIKGDSVKASNGAEGGSIKIDGDEAGNKIVAVIEYEGTDNYYSFYTLADAVAKAQAGETVKLIADATGAGVVINKSITIDFNGKTYIANEGVGSAGTQTLGLQILKDNNVTLKNGTLKSEGGNVKMLVQNYANLTVDNMKLVDATDAIQYVLSNNCGNVVVKNASEITANGAIAFDACKYANYALPTVTIEEGVVVTGDVEVSATLNFAGTLDGKIIINGAEGVVNSTVEGLNVTTTIEGRNVVYTNGVYTTAEFEPVAKVNGKNYASLREAVDAAPAGAEVTLLKNVTLEGGYADDPDAGLRIEKAIKINGQLKYTIDCGKFSKGIRVYNPDNDTEGSNEFYGVTIVNNNVNGRCIDTREGNINLIITESHLIAQNGNSQPLTLGGSEPLRAVTIRTHSTIDAGKSGYAVINFVTPGRFINVAGDCKISGYAAFYVKADNTKLQLANVVVTGENVHNGDTNGFGAIVVESSNNTITLNARAKVKAVANSDQFQSAFLIMSGDNNNIVINNDAKVPAEVVLEGENAYLAMVDENASATFTKYGVPMPLVAQCDNIKYLSLDEAYRASENGSTVKLLANVALDTKKVVAQNDGYATLINVKDKAITLDLNGKTINVAAAASDLANKAKGDMLLSVFHADTNGQLTLVDSSEAQTGAVNVLANDAKIYCLAASESKYEDKSESGKIIVNGGTYTLDRAADSMFFSDANEVITINGGNFTLGNVGTGSNGMPWIFNTYERNERHVNVYGGTFNADINHQYWAFEVNVPKELALRNNNDGTWTVVDAEAWVLEKYNANYNREVGYATLEEALAVSNNVNNTVTLAKDVEVVDMITVANGKTLVLNLNGKTLSAIDNTSKNYSLIDNRGDLTITGEGVMTVEATVNSGWNRYSAVIANNPGGKLTVNGGTIKHLGGTDMAYGIDNLTNGKGTYAETIINGGTIKSPYRAIRQFLNGVEADNILTVNGGTIEGANKSIWMQDPSKNANTGSLTVGEEASLNGNVYLTVTAGSTEWPVKVKIAKAALEGESKVLSSNVPEGYAVSEYETYWTVEALRLATLTIEDDCVSYQNVVEKQVGELTYVRNFENTEWQTIYLPFAVPASEFMNQGLEVAYIYNASYKNGVAAVYYVVVDDNYTLEANYPYLIKANANSTGKKSIVVENAKLMPTAVKSIDCSSVFETFTFTGNYATIEDEPCDVTCNKRHFVMNNGAWTGFDALNPFRVYMTIELRKNDEAFPTEESINMVKVDKNGNVDTSVEKIGVDADILGIYDLQGRRVLEPQKGEIYIINGKKVVY